MKKKSLLVLTLVTLLCICSIGQAFAVGGNEKSDLISKEEFANTMTKLYKKYDLKFEVIDDSNYNPITREVFESELNETEKSLVDSINSINEDNEKLLKLLKENELSTFNDVTPKAMFIDKALKGSTSVRHSTNLAYVTIKYETESTYNGSNGEFVSVTSPGLWYSALGLNLDSVEYDRKEWYITSARTKVVASAAGIVTFTYTHPSTGISITAEQPFTVFTTFTVNS